MSVPVPDPGQPSCDGESSSSVAAASGQSEGEKVVSAAAVVSSDVFDVENLVSDNDGIISQSVWMRSLCP